MFGYLIALFFVIAVITSLWFVVIVFKKGGMRWGFAVLFIPFAPLYFAVKHWSAVKIPVFISMAFYSAAILILIHTVLNVSNTEQVVDTAIPLAKGKTSSVQLKSLTAEEKQALEGVETLIRVIEKLPKNERQQQFLNILNHQVDFKKRFFSEAELDQFRKEVETLLSRTDLDKDQRTNFETLLANIISEQTPVTMASSLPPAEQAFPETIESEAGKKTVSPKTPAPISLTPNAPEKKKTEKLVQKKQSAVPTKKAAHFLGKPQNSKEGRYKRIIFAQAKNHIGSEIRFEGPRGKKRECILVSVENKEIQCKKDLQEGLFSYAYHQHEIKTLKVRLRD